MHIAGYPPLKMKRKDFDDVSDEFSDCSLSSPARKIRRLDAELSPIIEEEEREVPLIFDQPISDENISSNIERVKRGPVIEELPSVSENDERAIVLFKTISTPLLQSPSNFSVSVSPDIIYGFKNQVFWSNQYNPVKPKEDEAADGQKSNADKTNQNLAVVPWIPSQLPPTQNMVPQAEPELIMEAEEMEIDSMDIEDNNFGVGHREVNDFGGTSIGEGLHQWPQQHCMIPQLPQNTSTPIVWYR